MENLFGNNVKVNQGNSSIGRAWAHMTKTPNFIPVSHVLEGHPALFLSHWLM